jgi:GNAT superfamily N-acetyltransferase
MPLSEASAPVKPPMDELPQLSTYTAESEDDRIEGLRLVADSVAQQRQVASKMMIFHPINLAILGLVVAIVTQYILRASGDLFLLGTTLGGIAMTFLIAVRYVTGGYIGLAEDIDMDWLGEDRLVVAKWGKDVIGALVLGWADHDAAKKRGRRRRGKAVVRAWTVMLKYRGKGVGEGLLEEAVKVAGERGADGIIFDADHASKCTFRLVVQHGTLTDHQTPSVYCLQSTTRSSISKKQRQRRHCVRWQMIRATSASANHRPPGEADRRRIVFFGGRRSTNFLWKIPHPSLRYPSSVRYHLTSTLYLIISRLARCSPRASLC